MVAIKIIIIINDDNESRVAIVKAMGSWISALTSLILSSLI